MKKLIFILIAAIVSALCGNAFAADTDVLFMDKISSDTLMLCDEPEMSRPMMLFSASDSSQSLDYSLLDGVLTVEVENEAAAEQYCLIVAEYNTSDIPIKIHMINDIREKNVVGRVYGEYEKAFLWDMTCMRPACDAVSTKTDFEIVEGREGDWSVSPDGHMLYAYLGQDTDVTVPNSYLGKRITSIYNRPAISAMTDQTTYAQMSLFNGKKDITSFVISEGIERLGPCSFAGCGAECPLILPDTLKYIGNCAFISCINLTGGIDLTGIELQSSGGFQFAYCEKLDGELTLPNGEIIPKAAFYGCKNLTGGIDIPNGVKRIEDYAFSSSSGAKFTSLTLPDTLEWIGKAAFQSQTRIKNELIFPQGLKHIGDASFNHCSSIPNTVVVIPAGLESIGGDLTDENGEYINTGYGCHVFYDSFKKALRFEVDEGNMLFASVDGVLYSKDITRLVAYPPAKADPSFMIPEGVTQIDEMAFGHSKFKTLTLPDSYIISQTVPENVLNNMANTLAVAAYHYNALQGVYVKETNPNYKSVGGVIYSHDGTELWYVPPKITTEGVTVEEGCERMMSGACWMESNSYSGELYTSISIPASVSAIHENTMKDLNRKINNSQQGFIIYLDSRNESFMIDQNGKIVYKTQ